MSESKQRYRVRQHQNDGVIVEIVVTATDATVAENEFFKIRSETIEEVSFDDGETFQEAMRSAEDIANMRESVCTRRSGIRTEKDVIFDLSYEKTLDLYQCGNSEWVDGEYLMVKKDRAITTSS